MQLLIKRRHGSSSGGGSGGSSGSSSGSSSGCSSDLYLEPQVTNRGKLAVLGFSTRDSLV